MQSIRRKQLWRKVLEVSLIALIGYLVVCWCLAGLYLRPARSKAGATPEWVRAVTIPSAKGPVPAWASPRLADGRGRPVVFVLAFGYGGNRDGWAEPMQELPARGFECVAPCMPGQDESPDDSVGFGPKEAAVLLDAVKWVRSKYAKAPRIVLWGVSMGGAAAWLASEQDPSIDAVVTEGAYARFDDVVGSWLNAALPGAGLYLRPMVWIASARAKINPAAIRPVDAAAKWRKPALVVQGDQDRLIPMKQAQDLAAAAHCPLWVVHGASHAGCFDQAKTEFLQRLIALAHGLESSSQPAP